MVCPAFKTGCSSGREAKRDSEFESEALSGARFEGGRGRSGLDMKDKMHAAWTMREAMERTW